MKNQILLILSILGFISVGTAQEIMILTDSTEIKTENFIVYGNCGMCERTIEGALKENKSITLADWDNESQNMKVTYNAKHISLDQIKQKIADVGYDSDTHRAKKTVYDLLPGCCQYERPE